MCRPTACWSGPGGDLRPESGGVRVVLDRFGGLLLSIAGT
jgi:hypothetical protein